jgi:hypothetical protein
MKTSRVILVAAMVTGLLVAVTPGVAQVLDPEWNYVSIADTSECGLNGWGATVNLERVNIEGMGNFYWDTVATWGAEVLMDEYFAQSSFSDGQHTWGIYDANDRGNQTMSFDDVPPSSTIDVTITLWDAEGQETLDQDSFSFTCGEPAAIPTLGRTSLGVLSLFLLILGGASLRRLQGRSA